MTFAASDRRRDLERLCDRTFGLLLNMDARSPPIPARAVARFYRIWRPFDAGEVRFDKGRRAFLAVFAEGVERAARGGAYEAKAARDRAA